MNLRQILTLFVCCFIFACNQVSEKVTPTDANQQTATSEDNSSDSDTQHCVAPDYHSDLPAFNAYAEKMIAAGKLHGVAVGVVSPDGLSFFQGYGIANRDTNQAITQNSVFRIASVSKTFTATSLMQATQNGLITCDTNIADQKVRETGEPLLPFKLQSPQAADAEITPRMVNDYFSSISDNWDILTPLYGSDVPMSEFLEGYLVEGGTYYTSYNWKQQGPGNVWCYSNVSATLIAYLAGRSANMSFPEYSRSQLLKPLEMDHSAWFEDALSEEAQANLTQPYSYINGQFQEAQESTPYPFYPAGGLFSTVPDVGNFMQMLLNDGRFKGQMILAPGSALTLGKGQHLPECDYESSCMWFRLNNPPGVIMKMGSSYGVTTMILIDFITRRAYVGLANGRNEDNTTASINALARIVGGMWCNDVADKVDLDLITKILESMGSFDNHGKAYDERRVSTCATCQDLTFKPNESCLGCKKLPFK